VRGQKGGPNSFPGQKRDALSCIGTQKEGKGTYLLGGGYVEKGTDLETKKRVKEGQKSRFSTESLTYTDERKGD